MFHMFSYYISGLYNVMYLFKYDVCIHRYIQGIFKVVLS